MSTKTTRYDMHLPVFKQGDDLASHLRDNNNDPVKSLIELSERYEAAAEICRIAAKVIAECGAPQDVDVQADTYCIWVDAPEVLVKPLVDQGILMDDDFDDECEEEYELS